MSKKLSKKEIIKQSAYQIYLEKDYQMGSVNEIVKRSEISKGSYYNYFKTKEEVYLELLRDFFGEWFKNIKEQISDINTIEEFVDLLLEGFMTNKPFIELLAHSQATLEENIEKEVLIDFKKDIYNELNDLSLVISLKLQKDKSLVFNKLMQNYSIIIGTWLTSKVPTNIQDLEDEIDTPIFSLFTNFDKDLTELSINHWKTILKN